MQELDWVRKAIGGFVGSGLTIFLDQINTFVALIVGILTAVYIIQQIRLSTVKQKKAVFDYEEGLIERDNQKKINATSKE